MLLQPQQHPATEGPFTFPLDGTTITIGRDPSCAVRVQGMGVSRRHAAISLDTAGCVIDDLRSASGLRVNGSPTARCALEDGDVITIGVGDYLVAIKENALFLSPFSGDGERGGHNAHTDASGREVTIGRDVAADLTLAHPLVSRLHASLRRTGEGAYLLRDHQSANGTFVNGRPVSHRFIDEGDIIQIGPYRLFLEQGRLIRADDANRIRLEAFDVTVRTKKATLLNGSTVTIPAGEFAAVLGISGAGKSTLVRALCGRLRIDGGQIFANRLPLKRFLAAFASNIGYAAQENLLIPELTVAETFDEQCRIRLPGDSTVIERKSRIDEVIALLDLDGVRNRRVHRLSGGEAKRVHLGVELLASPALIVLDEPLAGLDPGLVRKFMKLFRRISDRGHTVLMTTHTLEQLEYCDRLIFMHRGAIVFSGQPSELQPFFGTGSLADIYETIINGMLPPPKSARRDDRSIQIPPSCVPGGEANPRKPRTISAHRQFRMLTARFATIACRNRRTLLLTMLQAPAIALFLGFVFKSETRFLPLSFYFCITISAIWMSGINAAREIAGEWKLLDREYRAGLSLAAYLCAKVTSATVMALVQAGLFLLFLGVTFKAFSVTPETFVLIAAGSVSGVFLGLCISALSGSVSGAMAAVPIIFIPQIFFSGILIPFDRMPDIGRFFSYLTVSRPVFGLFKHVCLLDQPLSQSPAWPGLCFLDSGLIILMAIAVRRRLAAIAAARY